MRYTKRGFCLRDEGIQHLQTVREWMHHCDIFVPKGGYKTVLVSECDLLLHIAHFCMCVHKSICTIVDIFPQIMCRDFLCLWPCCWLLVWSPLVHQLYRVLFFDDTFLASSCRRNIEDIDLRFFANCRRIMILFFYMQYVVIFLLFFS